MYVKKKYITLIISALLLQGTTFYAEPLTEQLQKQQKQLQDNQAIYNSIETEKEALEIKIQEYDAQIEELMMKIEKNKERIEKTESQIYATEGEIKKLEQEIEEGKNLRDKRLSSLYKNGLNQYLSLILRVENFDDLINKIDSMKRISDYDKEIIDGLQEKADKLNKISAKLAKTKSYLLDLKKSDEKRLEKINKVIEEQKKVIEELEAKRRVYASRITEAQMLVNETLAKIEEMNRQSLQDTGEASVSRGGNTDSNNEVLIYAFKFLGTPYKWGGISADTGFDCSGFTQYVYGHFGIEIGRTTWDQIKIGVPISREELQVGDLVLFGKKGNPTHVGIYAGNNTYIHAPHTGDVVKISAMTRNDFITGRRIK